MVLRVIAAVLVLFACASARADAALDHAKEVLAKSILFDGHNDLPWEIRQSPIANGKLELYDIRGRAPGKGQTDIPRLREGGVGAVFWSVYTPPEAPGHFARTQLEQIDLARRIIERYPAPSRLPRPLPTSVLPRPPARSAACWAPRAATRSRTRWGRCAPTTTSACAT